MKILGLDISSQYTGVAVIENGKLIHSSVINTANREKIQDLYAIVDVVQDRLEEIIATHDPDKIYIEEHLKRFSAGFSSANTIIKLAQVNALVSFVCYKSTGKRPNHINASTARKLAEIEIPKKTSSKDTKKLILEWVCTKDPNFCYNLTRAGNPVPGTYDRSDAYVIAKAGEIIEKSKA